jgi:CelD/BcsL family acetyltransferase involved in cellulose biosynthesis
VVADALKKRILRRRKAHVRLLEWEELTPREFEAWRTLRASNPALDSPYFDLTYIRVVHQTGSPVHVIVAYDADGSVTALLPGHLRDGRFGPPGEPGTDFQGPIVHPDRPIDWQSLFVDGVNEIYFDQLLTGITGIEPFIARTYDAPTIDLTGGLDGYVKRASHSGRKHLRVARNRAAAAERELGLPVRFTPDNPNPGDLAQLLAWKYRQYARTGRDQRPLVPPERYFRLLETRSPEFAGNLSTLHLGDKLIAACFDLRSRHVIHGWVPHYDMEFARLQPGWLMMRGIIEAAPAMGLRRYDLGMGDEEYKRWLKTGESYVHRVTLTRPA